MFGWGVHLSCMGKQLPGLRRGKVFNIIWCFVVPDLSCCHVPLKRNHRRLHSLPRWDVRSRGWGYQMQVLHAWDIFTRAFNHPQQFGVHVLRARKVFPGS